MKIPGVISRHSKLILRIIGTAGLLASLYLIVVGVVCLAQGGISPDEEGYYKTWAVNIRTESHAVIIRPDGTVFGRAWELLEIHNFKVEITGNNPSEDVFIGTAGDDDIGSYLDGVEYEELVSLRIFPGGAEYVNSPGNSAPGEPAQQDFWNNSAFGVGTQTLKWNPESGRAYLVIMNNDASAGMDIRLVIGAKMSLLFISAIGNLTLGGFILLLSLFMLLSTRRARNIVYPPPLTFSEPQKQTSESDTPDTKQ